MKLGLDENGELKVMPDFHSVFDAARFALSQYVSIPTDYPIAYANRVGVATCECCGRLFIKNGNRQKYCDNPQCKMNETAENLAQLITGKYRKKMTTSGRDHGCFHTGARCGK